MCVSSVELPLAEVTAKAIREDLSGRIYQGGVTDVLDRWWQN